MSDRTSANIFGMIFELLSIEPTDDHKNLASDILDLANDYDFSYCQMEADEVCIDLGLAIKRIDPDDGEEYIIFKDEEGFIEPEKPKSDNLSELFKEYFIRRQELDNDYDFDKDAATTYFTYKEIQELGLDKLHWLCSGGKLMQIDTISLESNLVPEYECNKCGAIINKSCQTQFVGHWTKKYTKKMLIGLLLYKYKTDENNK